METQPMIQATISPANAAAVNIAKPPAVRQHTPAFPESQEAALRDKAAAVSTEFVEHYRKALGNLLMTLRADLESRATADWERLCEQAQYRVAEAEQRVRRDWEQQQELRAREDRRLTAGLEEARKLFDAVQEQLQSADEHIKSLLKVLPKVIEQRIREALAPTVQELRSRLEGEFSAEVGKRLEQLQQRSAELGQNMQHELRRKGMEQLERREAELLDHVGVRLEEVRAANCQVREQAAQAASALEQRAGNLWAELSARMEARSQQVLEDAASRLEERTAQFRQAAESAVGRLIAQAWSNMQRSVEARFQHQQSTLETWLRQSVIAVVEQSRGEDLKFKKIVQDAVLEAMRQGAGHVA